VFDADVVDFCTRVSEKRRFIKRDAAAEPADDDVQPSVNDNSRIAAAAAAAAETSVNQSTAEKSSIINGHTSVECQPSEQNAPAVGSV